MFTVDVKKLYLATYNGAMCAGWSVILYKIIRHLASGGSITDVYPEIEKLLCVFQTGAIAEILHSLLGIVHSPLRTTIMQVSSRLMILYGVLRIGDSPALQSPYLTQMVSAWSCSEIIRYAYYFTNLLNKTPSTLTWLRYSAFTILYPLGISGEVMSIINALPIIKEKKPWTIEMPNALNFSFSFYYFMWALLVGVYPYASYVMYSYMLRQRRKMLGSTKLQAKVQK